MIIMKKKPIMIGIFLIASMFWGMLPVNAVDGGVLFQDSESVSFFGTDNGNSFAKMAIVEQPNEYANLWMQGFTPAQIDRNEIDGTSVDSFSTVEGETYPRELTALADAKPENQRIDPFEQVSYLNFDNTSGLTGSTPQFTVTSSIERVANITHVLAAQDINNITYFGNTTHNSSLNVTYFDAKTEIVFPLPTERS